jgi:hypothetical protein
MDAGHCAILWISKWIRYADQITSVCVLIQINTQINTAFVLYSMLCYVSIYIEPFPLVSKCSKALFSSLSRCDTHHSMFNVMFLESNQETVLACSRYRALPTIFMTGSAGIWTQGLITSWLKLWCSRPFTHASPVWPSYDVSWYVKPYLDYATSKTRSPSVCSESSCTKICAVIWDEVSVSTPFGMITE